MVVVLRLRDLATKKVDERKVTMTEANRQLVRDANNSEGRRPLRAGPLPPRLDRRDVERDLEELVDLLDRRHSYRRLKGVDLPHLL